MTSPASVGGDDRLRLFCGFRLPGSTVDELERWQASQLRGRVVPRGNLHVTLAFLGSRPAGELTAVAKALREAAARVEQPVFRVARYRETRSVGMLVLEEDGRDADRLAADLHERLEALGLYRREARPWLPHVTVVRFRDRPRLRPEIPELGAFSPSDVAVYHSALSPSGAQYTVLESAPLGG
jgi:RNA 2',3'-cyclic 3'-phosphodiesterase